MIVICPCCNGLGYRPGPFVWHDNVPHFVAIECKACGGKGTQFVMDPVPVSYPAPIWNPWIEQNT